VPCIQGGAAARKPFVEVLGRGQPQWVVQPLIDAGVELDQIRVLVFRLAFEDIVGVGPNSLAGLRDLVADRPAQVRAAWAQTIGRLLLMEPPSSPSAQNG
jgi:hypothetical protein